MTVKRIGGKLKMIRTNFEKAVDTNKRSGGGRVILKFKCLFTNIQKQMNMLKISLLFKKIQIVQENNSKILRVLFLYKFECIGRFSNLH